MSELANKRDAFVKPAEVCCRAFELMAGKQFEEAERLIAHHMGKCSDDAAIALYHSALGVMFKMQGEYKNAWRQYERAEKLLPDDPALKIISARLLIEQFAEYRQAIKKAKKVLEIIPDNAPFAHQAHTTMGLAYCKKGDKRSAISMLEASWGDDFKGFITPKNIDFTLLEALLKKGWGVSSCYEFLTRAKKFAESTGEGQYIRMLTKMMAAFQRDFGSVAEDTEITDIHAIPSL